VGVVAVKAIQLLEQRDKSNEFINENYDELIKKFSNKFIAVKDQKVIASGKDFEKVIEQIKKKGLDPSLAIIRFIFKKGHEFIL